MSDFSCPFACLKRSIRFADAIRNWESCRTKNLNPVRAGCVCGNAVVRSATYAECSAGSSYAAEAASSGVYCECWESHAAGSRRDMPAGAPRPEGNASGGSPPLLCNIDKLNRRTVTQVLRKIRRKDIDLFPANGYTINDVTCRTRLHVCTEHHITERSRLHGI